MIVVTGASGRLGRKIVDQLVDRMPANHIGVSVRNPMRAQDLKSRGVRVRYGNFDDAASLAHAFEGAETLLIVSSNARASGGDPIAQHNCAIRAAKTAGIKRILYTSHMAASPVSLFPPMHDHYATEQLLAASGLAWTALRHGFYAESGIFFMGDAHKSGVLAAPADGKVSWTSHDDLAESAALMLTKNSFFEGPTPPLTGSESLDFADLALIASDLIGRPIQRDSISDEAHRATMFARKIPSAAIQIALAFYSASRTGEFAAADPTLEQLLGRKTTSVREMMAQKFARN